MSEKNINLAVYAGRRFPPLFKALKFILISYLVSIILFAVVAAIVVYTNVPEYTMPLSVKTITFSGAFMSAFFTCRSVLTKGWIYGTVTSAIHVLLLNFFAVLCTGADFAGVFNFATLMVSAVCGFVGGISGVNSTNK